MSERVSSAVGRARAGKPRMRTPREMGALGTGFATLTLVTPRQLLESPRQVFDLPAPVIHGVYTLRGKGLGNRSGDEPVTAAVGSSYRESSHREGECLPLHADAVVPMVGGPGQSVPLDSARLVAQADQPIRCERGSELCGESVCGSRRQHTRKHRARAVRGYACQPGHADTAHGSAHSWLCQPSQRHRCERRWDKTRPVSPYAARDGRPRSPARGRARCRCPGVSPSRFWGEYRFSCTLSCTMRNASRPSGINPATICHTWRAVSRA